MRTFGAILFNINSLLGSNELKKVVHQWKTALSSLWFFCLKQYLNNIVFHNWRREIKRKFDIINYNSINKR